MAEIDIEHRTGYMWLNDTPIYRKVVDFGALPNATTKTVPHNINDLHRVVAFQAVAFDDATGIYTDIPALGLANGVEAYVDGSNCRVASGGDATAYGECWFTIEYTKVGG